MLTLSGVEHARDKLQKQKEVLQTFNMREAGAGTGERLIEFFGRFRDQPLTHPFWRAVAEEGSRRGVRSATQQTAEPGIPGPKAYPDWLNMPDRLTFRLHDIAREVWAGGVDDNQFTGIVHVEEGIGTIHIAPLIPGPQGSTNYPYTTLGGIPEGVSKRAPILHTPPAARSDPSLRLLDDIVGVIGSGRSVAKKSVFKPSPSAEADILDAHRLAVAVAWTLHSRVPVPPAFAQMDWNAFPTAFNHHNFDSLKQAAGHYPDKEEVSRVADSVLRKFEAGNRAMNLARSTGRPFRGDSASHQLLADRFGVHQDNCVGFSVAQGPRKTVKRFGWTSRSSNKAKFDVAQLPKAWSDKITQALTGEHGLGPPAPPSDEPQLLSAPPPAPPPPPPPPAPKRA